MTEICDAPFDLCHDIEKSCRDIFSYFHLYFCRDKKELCHDIIFLLQSKVRTHLVAIERNYVATNFPTTEMRVDSNSIVTKRKQVATLN